MATDDVGRSHRQLTSGLLSFLVLVFAPSHSVFASWEVTSHIAADTGPRDRGSPAADRTTLDHRAYFG